MPKEEPCLAFANTVEWHRSGNPIEGLKGYQDLLAWSQKKGLLDERRARALVQQAKSRPVDAEKALRKGVVLREAIYRIFSARAAEKAPRDADIEILNDYLPNALSKLRISEGGEGYVLDWPTEALALDQMLWPIAKSAADLLVSRDSVRVRECANLEEGCGWLFLDTTKNQSKRWCEMDSCGNRAKARRYYHRNRPKPN